MVTFRQWIMVGLGIWTLLSCAPSNTAATPEVQQVEGRVATETDLPPGPGWRAVARGAWVGRPQEGGLALYVQGYQANLDLAYAVKNRSVVDPSHKAAVLLLADRATSRVRQWGSLPPEGPPSCLLAVTARSTAPQDGAKAEARFECKTPLEHTGATSWASCAGQTPDQHQAGNGETALAFAYGSRECSSWGEAYEGTTYLARIWP